MNIKNTGLDMNSLFSSLNTSGSSSFAFTDYAAIKNGSYKKLMKAYYSEKKTGDLSTAKKTAEDVSKKTDVEASDKGEKKSRKSDVLTTLLSDYQKPYTKDATLDNTTQTGAAIDTSV